MSTIIMDLCSYTRLGLTGYLVSRGVKKREINNISNVDELSLACVSQQPAVVFINEDCFIHDPANSQQIKQIINQHPSTLFIVFMAIANVHFDEYLLVRKNLLISSKSIKPDSLDKLLGDILKKEVDIAIDVNLRPQFLPQPDCESADIIIKSNRIQHAAYVDGGSGNNTDIRSNEYQSQDGVIP